MFKTTLKTIAIATVIACGYVSLQSPTQADSLRASFAAVGSSTSVPFGWVDFCARYGGECPNNDLAAEDIDLSAKNYKVIERINRWVNTSIEPVSDMDHWGLIDQWDLPSDGKGDCEDYALLKRKMLMEEGFPRQALLMTVVRDRHNEGHAILTIKTGRGEFVLDNLHNEVKPWTATGYRFVKRQSQVNPNVWVSIGEPASAPYTASR